MKETAKEIVYKSYLDYGIIVVVAVLALAALWFLMKYVKTARDKYILEKEKHIERLEQKLEECGKEMKRLIEITDHTNDVVTENSKALYENASVTSEVRGILLILSEKLK